jgi:GR25 family glycosyltransferase involved in LPS biosynthesis
MVPLLLLCMLLLLELFSLSGRKGRYAVIFAEGLSATPLFGPASSYKPPAYFINLESNKERYKFMTTHLKEVGFKYVRRVNALSAKTCNLIMLESSCYRRVGFHEIAIVCSHLSALYQAIILDDSEYAKSSPYALILEDDVRFSFDVDFDDLVAQAPKGFGMIQLMMSHSDHIIEQAHMYFDHNELFGIRYRNSTVWSAQAILVNKEKIRPFIMNAVRADKNTGTVGYIIAGSYAFSQPNDIHNPFKPSIASQCIFSDMYIYSMGEPVYILNAPLVNGAGLGLNSSSHSTHVPFHIHGFAEIEVIQRFLTSQTPMANPHTTNGQVLNPNPSSLLPSFAKPFRPYTLSDTPFNWTFLALKTQKTVFPGVKPFKIRDH